MVCRSYQSIRSCQKSPEAQCHAFGGGWAGLVGPGQLRFGAIGANTDGMTCIGVQMPVQYVGKIDLNI